MKLVFGDLKLTNVSFKKFENLFDVYNSKLEIRNSNIDGSLMNMTRQQFKITSS